MLKFDLESYIRTKDSPSGPVYMAIETAIPEGEASASERRTTTRGQVIGNAISFIILTVFVCAMFYVL
jgi:hypothetical protein